MRRTSGRVNRPDFVTDRGPLPGDGRPVGDDHGGVRRRARPRCSNLRPFIDEHGSALRLAHYPAVDGGAEPGQLRAGAHTDYGTLTVLWTDGQSGLQVETAAGEWIDVDDVDGGLIVNLGDLMQRWTNDRWRSTMHRVVVPGFAGRRLSIPFFHNANWDARIECIVAGDEPRYPPTTAGRHLMEKFRSTQAVTRATSAAIHRPRTLGGRVAWGAVSQRFYIETLGCPKNHVDSDKLIGALLADGMESTDDAGAGRPGRRQHLRVHRRGAPESIDTILALDEQRREGSRLVVTGCMAERYGDELAAELPEVDQVAGFGEGFTDDPGARPRRRGSQADPRVDHRHCRSSTCSTCPDRSRRCRGRTSRSPRAATARAGSAPSRASAARSAAATSTSILAEVDQLEAREIVLVAQDLASYGKDRPGELGAGSIVPLVQAVADAADRVRLLYLYPSDLSDALIDVICDSGRAVLRPVAAARQQAVAAPDASMG